MDYNEMLQKKYFEKVIEDIESDGWHIKHKFPTEYSPGFIYTTGLSRNYNHPEIIILGLPQQVMQHIIQKVIEGIKAGKKYEPGQLYSDLIDGHSFRINQVHSSQVQYYLETAMWFYDQEEFNVIQIVWPDKQGYFPDDHQFDPKYIRAQPMLDNEAQFKFSESKELLVSTDIPITNEKITFVFHQDPGVWHFYSDLTRMVRGDVHSIPFIDVIKFQPELNQFYDLSFGEYVEWSIDQKEWVRPLPLKAETEYLA